MPPFWWGSHWACIITIDRILHQFPFEYAHRNFYRSAEQGMEAIFVWPNTASHGLREISVCALAKELLPIARQGLEDYGVDNEEIQIMLQVIADCVETRMNGACWQIHRLTQYEKSGDPRPMALTRMLDDYLQAAQTGAPVSQWSLKPQ